MTTSALLLSGGGPGAPTLADDLVNAGLRVQTLADRTDLLQEAIRTAPDLVVLFDVSPDAALFGITAALDAAAPRPVVLFTTDPDAEKIALATRSGVHAYVVNGYGPNRLRSVIHLAQARFRHERLIREELADLNQRFTERKLVDRAKGILMGARQLREEEAYRALRSAAMHAKQRIGQVAQRVIDSAHYAEAVNRAGQLRMLSQRLAKLYALACAGFRPEETRGLLADSADHIGSNIASLSRALSKPTFGDLLDAVVRSWGRLQATLARPAAPAQLASVHAEADEMLLRAEQLTANLEAAGTAPALRVINVAGRQRMLCQRLAKEALMAALSAPDARAGHAAARDQARSEFLEGFAYLRSLPLSNADIDAELDRAVHAWEIIEGALPAVDRPDSLSDLADASEALLAQFERVTDQLERGIQGLL